MYIDVWNVPNNGEIMRTYCANVTRSPLNGSFVADAAREAKYSEWRNKTKLLNKAGSRRAGWYHVRYASLNRRHRRMCRFIMYVLAEVVRLLKVVTDRILWSAIAIIIGPNLLAIESENHVVMKMIRMTEEIAEVRVRMSKLTITRDVRQRLLMAVLQAECLMCARQKMNMILVNR
jgi:hypothetical protein